MNVFDFATKMELDGKAHYEKLAAETNVPGLKSLFASLAADEQKHYETILAMQKGTSTTMVETTVLTEAKNVFAALHGEKSQVATMRKEFEGCQYGMKIEAESVRLYEDMAAKENRPEIAALLLRIAAEEKKHYNIMENLYEFILKPEYFLEWREFSNLKTF